MTLPEKPLRFHSPFLELPPDARRIEISVLAFDIWVLFVI